MHFVLIFRLIFEINISIYYQGPHAIAVPGEISGYWAAKRRYGNPDVSWERILRPTITMCREGISVSTSLASALAGAKNFTDPGMIGVFVNKETGDVWKEGDKYTNLALADTLEMLAEAGDEGDDEFYKGTIAEMIIADLREIGKIIINIRFIAFILQGLSYKLRKSNCL